MFGKKNKRKPNFSITHYGNGVKVDTDVQMTGQELIDCTYAMVNAVADIMMVSTDFIISRLIVENENI